MKAFTFFIALFFTVTAYCDAGVGRGGGGKNDEKNLRQRFNDVIFRAETTNNSLKNVEVNQVLKAIKNILKTVPLKIEYVDTLRYCDNHMPVLEKKDAWGCPGYLQLLNTFDTSDDSMIFHELTRITPGYEMIDEGMRLSVDVLNLEARTQRYLVSMDVFPKSKYDSSDMEGLADLRIKAGAEATNIKQDNDNYYLKTFWKVIEGGDKVVEPILWFNRH